MQVYTFGWIMKKQQCNDSF